MHGGTPVFHGTTAPGITKFRLGVADSGETDQPINGIWLGTTYEGAYYHAVQVAGRLRNAADAYIYQCSLKPDCIIADAKKKRMPPAAFQRFVMMYMPWYRRWAYKIGGRLRRALAQNWNWYKLVLNASLPLRQSDGYVGKHNAVIDVCRSIGIDAIVHPSTTLHGDGLAHWDDTVYGETVLLLNCDKLVPVLQFKV